MVEPKHLDGIAALRAAALTTMGKEKGEKDTEFLKRIVCAYINALPYADLLRQYIENKAAVERMMSKSAFTRNSDSR